MRAPALDRNYHLVSFGTADEGAAFLAALTRFLDSPRGSDYATRSDAPEVWSHRPGASNSIELFLSDAAFDAAIAGFGMLPLIATRVGEAMPASCSLAFGASGKAPAWGVRDAERQLGEHPIEASRAS
jgi:hypothetical protein